MFHQDWGQLVVVALLFVLPFAVSIIMGIQPPLAFPCGHTRHALDPVDSAFDVVCPICYGHFFRFAAVPYLLFVVLFSIIYFWQPYSLHQMLFIALSIFVAAYVSAVLRRRVGKLLLTLLVFACVTRLVLVQPEGVQPGAHSMDHMTFVALLLLGLAFTVSLLRAVAYLLGEGLHNPSPLLAIVIAGSFVVSFSDAVLRVAFGLLPMLATIGLFTSLQSMIRTVDAYKLAAVLVALGVAVMWAGGVAINAARIQVEEAEVHPRAWKEPVRLLIFIAVVLTRFYNEVWRLFRSTLRQLWNVLIHCSRIFLLVASAWGLSDVLYKVAYLTSVEWQRTTFGLIPWSPLWHLTGSLVLAWLAIWLLLLVAFVGDPKNSVGSRWSDIMTHAYLVVRFSLLRSTPLYSFYLSLVLFVAWCVINAVTFAANPRGGMHLGLIFVAYATLVIALGGAISVWQSLRKSPVR